MAWIEKQHQTCFETLPIHGLFFLDGDVWAQLWLLKYGEAQSPLFDPDWLKGHKSPRIEFPSGENLEVWESTPEAEATVHLFGEMDVAYRATRDEAFAQAERIAVVVGYRARARGETQFDVWSAEDDERFTLTYDNDDRRLVNVQRLTEAVERPIHPAHILLNDEVKATLPPLYADEKIGLEAPAPVKYFSPAAGWTWYAAEASAQLDDGSYLPLSEIDLNDPRIQDVLFFGLVIGFEIELGYFTLKELQSAHGGLGLPIERDLYYQPQTLRALKALHERER